MNRTSELQRKTPLCPLGKGYPTEEAARTSDAGQREGATIRQCLNRACARWHVLNAPARPEAPAERKRPADTGFPQRVKLLVRARAGNGEIADAACERCGTWLGRRGGQVHHIVDRGMGGCKLAVINGPANAALLCGTPLTGCHGLATAFDADTGAQGFWLSHSADPRLEPMMLHSAHGSGVLVWRGLNGRYLFEAPAGVAA